MQFAFVAQKKFSHVSLLHVVHHGIMPMSVWPGARFVPGGHASFFGFCNVFVHIWMYLYYFLAALGPQYRRYCWWKQHMTTLQMIQFVAIMTHGFQLIFQDDCDFPWQFSYYIGAHAVLFFILFSEFYVKEYFNKPKQLKAEVILKKCASIYHIVIKTPSFHFILQANGLKNGHQNGVSSHSNGKASKAKKDL